MERFIIPFGQDHAHRVNNYTFDKDSIAVIQQALDHAAFLRYTDS